MSNKALWQRAYVTDPRAVKEITGKQYRGNSPKPYWIVERLTDEFGPCGIGWGFTILNERFERFSETDSLHVASVRFWYVLDGVRGELEQIGQTKASYTTSKGSFMLDEDAPKKSVTDALVKCASYLGFAGDIFSGRWDDSKYVAEAAKEWRKRDDDAKGNKAEVKPINAGVISATDGAADALQEQERNEMTEVALHMIDCHRNERDLDAIRIWYDPATFESNEQRVFVWSLLKTESKLRALIKANQPEKEAA
jgi:hypothetical protein